MEGLAPPEILRRAVTAECTRLEVPTDGIARTELLKQYQLQMARPLPDAKVLAGELSSWSGSLARTKWFAEAYGPTAGLVLKGRTTRVSDGETLASVVSAVTELVDPLSQYSAGWSNSLAALRPKNLRNAVHVAIREAQRYGTRMVRRSMTLDVPVVHQTRDSAARFLADPARRHAQDRQTALDAYLAKVGDIVVKAGTASATFSEAEIRVLVELQESLIQALGAVPAASISQEQDARNREEATKFLDFVVETLLPGRKIDERHLAEAYSRVHVTYTNRLRRGLSLEGTENYLFMRLSAVRIDEWRRETFKKQHEGRFVAGEEDGSQRADDRVEDSTDASAEVSAAHMLLLVAAKLIADDPEFATGGGLCWEAQMARELLGGDARQSTAAQRDLSAFIARRWSEEKPPNSRSVSADVAATDVRLVMMTAVNRAKRALDDSVEVIA